MNFNAIENLNNPNAAQKNAPAQQEALRRAAVQFESILLMQLTSALNDTNKDEDALFGSDGGSDLAKQMFSEQLAATMADSGGVGLSDLILRQFGVTQTKTAAPENKLANALSAVKDIKGNSAANISNNISNDNGTKPLINKNGKIEPISMRFSGDANDVEIISTFADEVRAEGIDESLKNLELNGKIVNSTRARIVPDYALQQGGDLIPSAINASTNGTEKINFQMPVSGRISSNFGNRFHPIDKQIKFHAGIDIAAAKGSPIGAASEGVVIFAGAKKGYGNLVVVKHPDGTETRYGHAEKILVRANDKVSAGQLIATVGSTGKSTGPHLHFEVRENGQPVNPRNFLSNVLSKSAER